MRRADKSPPGKWMLLIHQIPPKPAYFRAKVGRRLSRVGAVAIKNSVYVLPHNDQTQEDLQWIAREIVAEGGEATLCTASFVEGLRDDQIEALFHAARDAEYATIAEDARGLASEMPRGPRADDEAVGSRGADVARLKKRLAEAIAIDFVGAIGRQTAQSAVDLLERRLRRAEKPEAEPTPRAKLADYRGRTWVTRKNIHVDRIASAWLVQRFIDPKATFRFVPGQGYRAKDGEVTFDMFEGDFTHVGDRCTFEVLVERFGLQDPGLRPIAEVVHDIDVKDGRFARGEVPGVAALIAGIAVANTDDDRRVEVGGQMFDALLALYGRKRA